MEHTINMKYSKRSLHFAWISLVIATLFLILSQISRDASSQFDMIIGYLITCQYMSILIGFAVAMMSLREERTRPQQWAFFINILLFAAVVSYFIYSYFLKAV